MALSLEILAQVAPERLSGEFILMFGESSLLCLKIAYNTHNDSSPTHNCVGFDLLRQRPWGAALVTPRAMPPPARRVSDRDFLAALVAADSTVTVSQLERLRDDLMSCFNRASAIVGEAVDIKDKTIRDTDLLLFQVCTHEHPDPLPPTFTWSSLYIIFVVQ
jgi:hypothetical protein